MVTKTVASRCLQELPVRGTWRQTTYLPWDCATLPHASLGIVQDVRPLYSILEDGFAYNSGTCIVRSHTDAGETAPPSAALSGCVVRAESHDPHIRRNPLSRVKLE